MFAVLPEQEFGKTENQEESSQSAFASTNFLSLLDDEDEGDDEEALAQFQELMGFTTSLESQKSVDAAKPVVSTQPIFAVLADQSTASQSSDRDTVLRNAKITCNNAEEHPSGNSCRKLSDTLFCAKLQIQTTNDSTDNSSAAVGCAPLNKQEGKPTIC